MRSLPAALLAAVFIAPAYAEERTWTISTGTYAMAAELIEIRGDIAYLKTGDRIEHVPLSRLSAADMKYIETLSPAQLYPGPVDESAAVMELPALTNEFNAAPPTGPILNAPVPVVPQKSFRPLIEPAGPSQLPAGATNRSPKSDELLPVPRSTDRPTIQSRKVNARILANTNTNVRRPATAERQNQNMSAGRNRSRYDERRGLFGLRSRRSRN